MPYLFRPRISVIVRQSRNALDKLFRNQHLWAAIVLIFVLIFFYRDVVFGGRTFLIESEAPGTIPGGPF